MNKILILIILLLQSCVSVENNKDTQNIINFSKNMSFNEFKLNLEKYAKESPYPDLNN